MRLNYCLAPALAALLLAANAQAQGTSAAQPAATSTAPASSKALSSTDKRFLQHAARGAEYELTIAKLAEQKAGSENVKQYSQMVVSDHEQLNSQLQQVAENHGMQLPTDMTRKQQEKARYLEGFSGTSFDREYEREIKRINKEDRADLRKEIKSTNDPSVKAFARKMQEADAKHQKMAQQLSSGS